MSRLDLLQLSLQLASLVLAIRSRWQGRKKP